MAEDAKPTNPGPFDVRTVKNLVALMASHDLAEIDLRDGMQRLRIRRGGQQTAVANASPVSVPVAPPQSPANSISDTPSTKTGKKLLEIKSESPGTFYAKPSPDAAPFVTVGSKVTPPTVVCTLEAMKLFSEIQAGVSGTIVEICVENQSPVEFGQVLFRVEG